MVLHSTTPARSSADYSPFLARFSVSSEESPSRSPSSTLSIQFWRRFREDSFDCAQGAARETVHGADWCGLCKHDYILTVELLTMWDSPEISSMQFSYKYSDRISVCLSSPSIVVRPLPSSHNTYGRMTMLGMRSLQ